MSNDLVTVGRVGRPHGIDGSFFVDGASDAPERFGRGARLLVDGEPAEVVVSKRGAGGRVVIKLDRAAPRGATLAVRREDLPEPEEDAYYVFNDMHAMMAFVAGGREVSARKLLDVLVRRLDRGGTNAIMTRDVGLPICRAIQALRAAWARTVASWARSALSVAASTRSPRDSAALTASSF